LIDRISNLRSYESLSAAALEQESPSAGGRKQGFLLGVVAVLGALLFRFALDPLWGDRLPYGWFFLAVLVVARFAGRGPQILTVVAGLALGKWFFIQPRYSLEIAHTVDQVNLVIFCILSGLVMFISAQARRMVRQELAARERIAGILECTTDAVCTLNREWVVTYLNKPASELTKTDAAQVLRREYWKLWPEMLRTRFESEFRGVMKRRETVHFEECHPLDKRWIEVHACPYDDGIAIFFRDVSLRKRAEASRAQLAAIVESSDDAIIGESMEGLIVSWNAAAEKLYGLTAAEAIGRSFGMLFPIEEGHELAPLLDRVRKGERVNHLETKQQTKGTSWIDVSLTVLPIQTTDLQIVGISITAQDISKRKREEAEREKLIKQLQGAMAEVKSLTGLLPICAQCKKIRDDKGSWKPIETYIGERSNATFSHGLCPGCTENFFPAPK
jgi:PAS domain S-box-containing protein